MFEAQEIIYMLTNIYIFIFAKVSLEIQNSNELPKYIYDTIIYR